jgi:hypothetical protein
LPCRELLSGCSGRDHRGLDGDPKTGHRSDRSRKARSEAEDGGGRLFWLRDAKRDTRGGKKPEAAIAES